MVLQNGYVTGSVFGPEWKHVQEWPQAGPSRLRGGIEETEQIQGAEEDEYEEEEEEVRSSLQARCILVLICLADLHHSRFGTERGSSNFGNGNGLSAHRKLSCSCQNYNRTHPICRV